MRKAFETDKILLKDLLSLQHVRGHPLGITLIPDNDVCKSCGGILQLRTDRPFLSHHIAIQKIWAQYQQLLTENIVRVVTRVVPSHNTMVFTLLISMVNS